MLYYVQKVGVNMARPKKLEKYNPRIMATITDELKDNLEKLAKEQQRSVSSLVCFILNEYFKTNHADTH